MKGIICQCILDNFCSRATPNYKIHFDKMLFSVGWFTGFVELWKGKKPREKNRRKILFSVHVINWGGNNDCGKRTNYRMVGKG